MLDKENVLWYNILALLIYYFKEVLMKEHQEEKNVNVEMTTFFLCLLSGTIGSAFALGMKGETSIDTFVIGVLIGMTIGSLIGAFSGLIVKRI
jgi:hypothetical protein